MHATGGVDSTPDPHAHLSRQRVTSHSFALCMAQVSKVKSVRVVVLCFTSTQQEVKERWCEGLVAILKESTHTGCISRFLSEKIYST